jgi:arabinose-5-phosphate isomerase
MAQIDDVKAGQKRRHERLPPRKTHEYCRWQRWVEEPQTPLLLATPKPISTRIGVEFVRLPQQLGKFTHANQPPNCTVDVQSSINLIMDAPLLLGVPPVNLLTPLSQLSLTSAEIIELGRGALHVEAAALTTFADSLGEDFVRAVELLSQPKGRIIVTGIGKSGHIGRKISATLSSIGRPALYVHPSEASHGDLGMIVAGDVLLALSNSGETSELSDIIAYCEGLSIPILAVVGNRDSTLAKRAKVVLAYGAVQEVCANGLAPTTSSTLSLAIGDALSVGVMSVLGTTSEHFYRFHPGGKLGATLMQVSDLMHVGDQLPIVSPDMPMKEVVVTMSSKGFGMAIVRDESEQTLGVITDGDMRRHIDVLWQSRAEDLLTYRPVAVRPTMLASDALTIMSERNISCLLVSGDDGKAVGLISIHDCLRAGV